MITNTEEWITDARHGWMRLVFCSVIRVKATQATEMAACAGGMHNKWKTYGRMLNSAVVVGIR